MIECGNNIYFLIYRDTASETVRTLLVYGYNLDPPTGETNEGIYNIFITSLHLLNTK